MTILEEAPRIKDEEVVPLMHTLELERSSATTNTNTSNTTSSSTSSSSKQHRLPLLQRLKAALQGFTPELLAIALVYFVQGILKLSSLAVTFFLKDHLKLEPTQMALAETITGLPWTVKPLYGFITDSFPINGMRRRPYLVLAGLLGCVAWLCMAALANSVPTALCFITTAALSTAFADVVADSIVVQLARASPGATEGALQSMCWSAHAFGRVITAYLSGWLVGKAGPRPVFAATATFPLIVCAASCLIRETPSQQGRAAEQHSQGSSSCPPEREQQLLAGAHAESSHGLAETGLDGTTLRPLGSQHSSSLSSQGSAVVLQSQLQLTQGHVHHKSRGSAATQYSDSQHSTPRHAAVGSPAAGLASAAAAEAAENGGVNGGACAAGRSCTSSSGGSKQRQRGCMQQVLINMLTSLKLFWNAIKQPHMLRPVVFLFLLLAMPQPDSGMFYFKTNKLKFDAEFFGRVKLVAALADLAGLAIYNAFLKSARLRPLMLWGGLLGCAVGLTPLMLVEGINRKLGVSDRVFAIVDSALLASIGQVLMMPTLVMCARLCPEGVEATLYASLMSLINAASGSAALTGALMMKLFGITSTNFDHLSALLLTCNLMSLLPLPLVRWVPDSSPRAVSAAAAAASADGQDRGADVEAGAAPSHRG